jgi:hypothetical protein
VGRLTLNVLLSFAQFEREVIGERVRHKDRGLHQWDRKPEGRDNAFSLGTLSQLFATQKLHQPFGSMGPSTFTQASGGSKLRQLSQRSLPFGEF